MRNLILIGFTLLLAACSKGGGKGVSASDNGPVPQPKPKPVTAWGDLRCQKTRNCLSIALNENFKDVVQFLYNDFGAYVRGIQGEEQRIYQCGVVLGFEWAKRFGGGGFDSSLDELFFATVNLETCSANGGVENNLKKYFIETREYKNEVL